MISGGLATLVIAVLWLLGQPPILAILAGVGAFQLPGVFIKLKAFLRMKKGADQFADVLDTMVNCFKTGYGFSRAVQQVADQFEDPWRTEFGKMAAEMALGAQMEDALNNLASRMPLPDVDLFVTAMVIQRETGGNLAELLGNLSNTCRDRYKLFRKIGAITAQGKLSAMVVGSVPFLLMAMMFMFMPEPTTEFATHPIGIVLLVLAGIWMMMGIGVLFKLVSIKV
jgi:tight adherence protein B